VHIIGILNKGTKNKYLLILINMLEGAVGVLDYILFDYKIIK